MKTNNKFSGVGFLKDQYYQVWANYFLKFFESYAKEGIQFWGVTTQNEPFDGFIPNFLSKVNAMGFTVGQMVIDICVSQFYILVLIAIEQMGRATLGPNYKKLQFQQFEDYVI